MLLAPPLAWTGFTRGRYVISAHCPAASAKGTASIRVTSGDYCALPGMHDQRNDGGSCHLRRTCLRARLASRSWLSEDRIMRALVVAADWRCRWTGTCMYTCRCGNDKCPAGACWGLLRATLETGQSTCSEMTDRMSTCTQCGKSCR